MPLRHQPNDGRMALAVNGVYRHADLTLGDLETHLGGWSPAAERSRGRRSRNRRRRRVGAPHPAAYPQLERDLAGFVSNLLAGERVGDLVTR